MKEYNNTTIRGEINQSWYFAVPENQRKNLLPRKYLLIFVTWWLIPKTFRESAYKFKYGGFTYHAKTYWILRIYAHIITKGTILYQHKYITVLTERVGTSTGAIDVIASLSRRENANTNRILVDFRANIF